MIRFLCFFVLFTVVSARGILGALMQGDIEHFNGTISLPNAMEENEESSSSDYSRQRSFAGVTINTNIFTLFYYKNSQIYVYNTLANENKYPNDPSRWIFYYIPIMAPFRTVSDTTWAWSIENEVRVNLMLGDREVEETAREAIAKKFDMKTGEYAKYWDIAPLMIESLTAFVVKGSSSPIAGVQPYHAVHPNSLNMIFRFPCSTSTNARDVARLIANGEYDIEIAFHFDGFKQTSTSLVSITAEQLKSITSKTTADGGNSDAKYIHRSQTSKFVGTYITNVKKLIYSESSSVDTQSLSKGLEDQFISLLQQGKAIKKHQAYYNCEGLRTHTEDLDILLHEYTLQIVVLTGVGSMVKSLPNIPEYYWHGQKGTNSFGGVAILIHNSINSKVVAKRDNFLVVELELGTNEILLGAVYVPPENKLPLDSFEIFKDRKFFLFGDFNAKHTSWDCKKNNGCGIILKEWIEKNGYEGIFPSVPTSKRSDAIIDFGIGYSSIGWSHEQEKSTTCGVNIEDHYV
ncbi:unnamed protein product [Adineta ricciae]|uniref:Endonuclease/exonuclease/phosphatase domain-containing protein n=1 Tax=Adineta ricciae TaxID=249248 RepID=A0A814QNK2_ADIRI|nr:unnamed protein product [Adineta ricciae]